VGEMAAGEERTRNEVVGHHDDRSPRRIPVAADVEGLEVLPAAARGDHRVIAAHYTDLGPDRLLHSGVAGDVVGMGVAGQEHPDVGHVVTERLDRLANQRDGHVEPAVDEDSPAPGLISC
jgi:hypothetical protein